MANVKMPRAAGAAGNKTNTDMKTVYIITHQGSIQGVYSTEKAMESALATLTVVYRLSPIEATKEAGLLRSRWVDRNQNTVLTVQEYSLRE